MKTVLWISFYFITFLAMILGLYYGKDSVMKKTKDVPVLNYSQYHRDAAVEDSSYTEKIDSLAVVVEGMLGELAEYVSQLQDRDFKLAQQQYEIEKLRNENKSLKEEQKKMEEAKVNYNKAQEEEKLQDLAKMLGTMKPDVLAPILANLPDNLVQIFYDKAKSRDRAKIFNALPPERAGRILTKMAN